MAIRTVGVIGAGGHLISGHLPFLQGTVVTGIYDPEQASYQAACEALGYEAPYCRSLRELMRQAPDAVLIGSPDSCHPQQLLHVVKAGVPVLCEKPLAISEAGLKTVRRALAKAQSKGLLVASCHQRRSMLSDLPYGWVRAHLDQLEGRFGPLKQIGLCSNYPMPRRGWKHKRSFLADKFVHDIDYLRALLGCGSLRADRVIDSYDHYRVAGSMSYGDSFVEFTCEGMRLHNDRDAFVEYILLNFEFGDCVVYTKTGIVRYFDGQTGEQFEDTISPMVSESYDRLNREVTQTFLNGLVVHTSDDLLVNTAAVVALSGPSGFYESP